GLWGVARGGSFGAGGHVAEKGGAGGGGFPGLADPAALGGKVLVGAGGGAVFDNTADHEEATAVVNERTVGDGQRAAAGDTVPIGSEGAIGDRHRAAASAYPPSDREVVDACGATRNRQILDGEMYVGSADHEQPAIIPPANRN